MAFDQGLQEEPRELQKEQADGERPQQRSTPISREADETAAEGSVKLGETWGQRDGWGHKIQKHVHPSNLAVSLLGICSEQILTNVPQEAWTKTFSAALLVRANIWKQRKCSSVGDD